MGLKEDLKDILRIAIIFEYALVFSILFVIGCASTGGSQAHLARQKALQDSLSKVHEFEMLKFKSFGDENFKSEMYANAIPHYWKVTELDTAGRFQSVYPSLGECYFRLDKLDSAGIVYRLAVRKFPENAHHHRTFGWLLNLQQEYDLAIGEYRKAIELDSIARADDYRNLGKLLVQQNLETEAIPIYEKLTEIEPDQVTTFVTLAKLYKAAGNEISAIAALESAVSLAPEDTNLLFRLGEELYRREEFEKAIEKFTSLVAANPKDEMALEILGNAYQNLDDFKNAISIYEKILTLKPDRQKVICHLAECYRELRDFVKANNLVHRALKVDSKYGFSYIVLGEIYEAAANDCIKARGKERPIFDDKLVYEFAYREYEKARQDAQFADLAKSKIEYIQGVRPTKEDWFMHPDQGHPQSDCYRWISKNH